MSRIKMNTLLNLNLK